LATGKLNGEAGKQKKFVAGWQANIKGKLEGGGLILGQMVKTGQ